MRVLGGQESESDSPQLSPLGKSLPEDQDLRGLLLLCVGAAGGPGRSCPLLCGDGRGHDRGYLVSSAPPRPSGTEGAPADSYPLACPQDFFSVVAISLSWRPITGEGNAYFLSLWGRDPSQPGRAFGLVRALAELA